MVSSMDSHVSLTELSNREFFIRRASQEYPAFVDVCRALPADKLDYRPHPASRSAGELVAMLVSLQQSSLELCEKGSSSLNSGLQWHSTGGLTSLPEMIAAFETHHRALVQSLDSLND